jgi:uncharacterized membrane protein YgcG
MKYLLHFAWALLAIGLVAAPSFSAEQAKPATEAQQPFKPEELEQIVAPIALYPDTLLAQVLMASTYPLEIVQAARWQKANPQVKGDAVAKAVEQETWDASVKSLVAVPDVLTMMNEKLDWTQKLGDAFLAQQKDLMDAVQRLRAKAKNEGNLKSGKEQTVKTEAPPAGSTTTQQIIIIEQSNPEVVYVPAYNPTVVYGAWPYPAYPPYYYYPPYYAPGAAFFSFSVGVIVGGAMWGNCNWGHSDIDIDVNNYNNFNRNEFNRNEINNGKWKHNPEHRQGVGYRDSATQQRYGRASPDQATRAREDFRGRQGDPGGSQRDFNSAQSRDLGGSAQRDLGGSGQRDFSTAPARDTSQYRDLDGGSGNRDYSGASQSRSSDAFKDIGSGSSARQYSNRGTSSRGGMSRGGGGRRR